LTYQHDPTSTVTITWQTTTPSAGDVVLYDIVPRRGNASQYLHSATGLHHTYAGASGHIHDVELTGLTPDTSYYFLCGGPGNYSEERAFQTAPIMASDFAFVAGGDSRTNPEDRTQVSKAMRLFDPAFVLHSGDMVEDGSMQGLWASWFTDVEENWVGDNGYTLPLIPCLGNHERNATHYYEQFALPGNEQWFYYDWGPALRIIVLNSEATVSQISTDQVNWLRRVLYSTSENTWKIVMFHRTLYSSGGYSNSTDLITYWVPLFDKYHVDIVIQGHTHHYHRLKPMKNNAEVSSYEEGTMYLTSAGWGAPLYDFVEQPYSAYGKKALHFTLFQLYQNGTLHVEAKDVTGATFDKVTLYKNISDAGPPDRLPEADAGANRVLDEDTVHAFDGSPSLTSTDQVSYTWAFMEDTPHLLSGVTVEYAFTRPGIYAVTLNVSDARGESDTATITVTVRDVTPPVTAAGGDQRGPVNTPVTFDASGSQDNVGITTYDWDFGDGVTGTGASVTHQYPRPEQYEVTLTVTDAAGNSDVGVVHVTVEAEALFSLWTLLIIGVVALVVIVVCRRTLMKPS
jgi:predicted phosphodiesterase